MKVHIDTKKFYPCYPVFIVSYYGKDGKPKVTTLSSSYSLANLFVMGMHFDSYLAECIDRGENFCINFLSKRYMRSIERAGLTSNHRCATKTEDTRLTFSKSKTNNAPYINEASVIFVCRTRKDLTNNMDAFKLVVSDIQERLCGKDMLLEGKFLYEKLDIPLLEADSHGSFYRYMNEDVVRAGSFFKTEHDI